MLQNEMKDQLYCRLTRTDEYNRKETMRKAKRYIMSISMAWGLPLMQKEPKHPKCRLPLRETALACKPINMSKRNPNSLLRVFKCFVFHMVSICIFVKELIYAFEILWPPNLTNHTAPVTSACAFYRLWISSLSFPFRKCRISQIHKSTQVNTQNLIPCVQIIT